MSISDCNEGNFHRSEQGIPERLPEPYPWCLACGFLHPQGDHCEGCNGDHSGGYCMTDELAAELEHIGRLRELVELEAGHLVDQLLAVLRPEGSER
jgi:hypothetical protein